MVNGEQINKGQVVVFMAEGGGSNAQEKPYKKKPQDTRKKGFRT